MNHPQSNVQSVQNYNSTTKEEISSYEVAQCCELHFGAKYCFLILYQIPTMKLQKRFDL